MVDDSNTKLDLKEAARYLGLGEQYIRTLVRKGLLPTTMVPLRDGAVTLKHMITVKDLDAFRDRETHRTGARADGRNKYLLYANQEEYEGVTELLTTNYPEVEIRRAYPGKAAAEPEPDEE